MKKLSLFVALLALGAPALLPSPFVSQNNRAQAAPGKVLLRMRLAPGQRFVTRMSMSSSTAMSMLGNKAMKQNMTMAMDTRVLAIAKNGTMTQRVTITGMKMVMDMNGQKMTMDAAKAGKEPGGAMFRAIVGVPLTMQITPTGKTLSLKGFDVMANRMIAAMPQGKGAPSAAQKQQMEAMMKKSFDPQKLTGISQNFYPPRAVGVGDSWSVMTTGGATMGTSVPAMKTTYKLLKRAGGISTLAATGTLSGAIAAASGAKMTGRQNMILQVDEKTGLARAVSGIIAMNMNMKIPAQKGGAPQTMKTATTIRLNVTTSAR